MSTPSPVVWNASVALIFGVRFVWSDVTEQWADKFSQVGPEEMYRGVLEVTRPHVLREQRTWMTYWDGMTALLRTDAAQVFHGVNDLDLAVDMAFAIQAQKLPARLLNRLNEHQLFARVHTRFMPLEAQRGQVRMEGVERSNPDRMEYGATGRWIAVKPGNYRRFELVMGQLQDDSPAIDWWDVAVKALLIQMHNDIAVRIESGYWRVACCQRDRCQGFFRVKRMDTRAKYCSNSCRVSASRDKHRQP